MNKNNYEKNLNLFNEAFLSASDVLIKPSTGFIKSRRNINIDSCFIFNSPMDTVASSELAEKLLISGQAAMSCRFYSYKERISELNKFKHDKNYWFCVGTSIQDYELIEAWLKTQKTNIKINISVDVAHGDTNTLHKVYTKYSQQPWCRKLMSGTVATFNSALNVFRTGCTHIRVGIGPGSACTTRIVTGCGVPNLSAIFDIWNGFQDPYYARPPFIIADGGIKASGDIAKYMAAGADAVMIGNLLSRTIESAGWKTKRISRFINKITFGKFCKGFLYKRYRGQASYEFQISRKGFISGTPEGVQGPIQYPEYDFKSFYNHVSSALQSTISYTSLKNLNQLNPYNVELIKITNNAFQESQPHILK